MPDEQLIKNPIGFIQVVQSTRTNAAAFVNTEKVQETREQIANRFFVWTTRLTFSLETVDLVDIIQPCRRFKLDSGTIHRQTAKTSL